MTEILNEKKYEVDVPYNNEVLVKDRKKAKLAAGIFALFAAMFFIGATIASALSETTELWVVLVFVAFDIFAVGSALYFFLTLKPNQKDENKLVSYNFNEYDLCIIQKNELTDKVKMLSNCLYRPHNNKQYVTLIIEKEDRFILKILTGYYNGVPQHKEYSIPKSIMGDKLSEFTDFLKDKVGKDYRVKIKEDKQQNAY